MINIFIDTNIYLNFYRQHSDEIIELQWIIDLITEKKAKVYITKQVYNEFLRNREKVINDVIITFEKEKLETIPFIIKWLPNYSIFKDLKDNYETTKKNLLKDIKKLIEEEKLPSDNLIREILKKSTIVEISDEIFTKSKNRFDLGNPPGKNGSYWDAVNRETLLNIIPSWEDLHFIAFDKDFTSVRNTNLINPFLVKEWKEKKNSNIILYKGIGLFFKNKFPHIKATSLLIRTETLRELIESPRFDETRNKLKKIQSYLPLNEEEFIDILDWFMNNNQIYNMRQYSPEYLEYIYNIVDSHFNSLEKDKKEEFIKLYWDNDWKLIT